MQLVTSTKISTKLHTNLLQSDFFSITQKLERKKHSASRHPFVNFRGQISVGEIVFPIQKFSIREEDKIITIENFPLNSFPKIKIILEKELVLKVKEFSVSSSNNNVEGEILYTRFCLVTAREKKISIHFIDISFSQLNLTFIESRFDEQEMLRRAKLFRKVGFIETIFERSKLNIPANISSDEIQQTEILYRGLTEGDFTNPSDSFVTFYNYKVSREDLINNFLFVKRKFEVEFDEKFFLFGRFFEVGKIIIVVEKASIANPSRLRNVKENEIINELKLNVFDSQIRYIFEKYNNTEKLFKNKQKLERYKIQLQKEEPAFLSSLLDESLAEINDKSAIETLEALLQYYDFPDRFSVLKPVLQKDRWKVPIALTYPKHEPILLTEAFVDAKTGKVEMEISFNKLLERGKKKAEEAFSIA